MKILLTAFEEFNNRNVNISKEVIKALDLNNHGLEIHKLYLPVKINTAFEQLKVCINYFNPDVIILTGEAINRDKLSIEIKAKNIVTTVLDKTDEIDLSVSNKVLENGENCYFSNFPTVEALSMVLSQSIPCILSNDAGGYICNALYYKTLHTYKEIDSVFIHFPNLNNIKLEELVKALEIIILSLSEVI